MDTINVLYSGSALTIALVLAYWLLELYEEV